MHDGKAQQLARRWPKRPGRTRGRPRKRGVEGGLTVCGSPTTDTYRQKLRNKKSELIGKTVKDDPKQVG